ncbi:hypothetical protein BDN72DRAFT_607954 [Pluteus cervinus]|uniref:Uncharacterized protein n=1 Tax=Pluteus cervinus TaxID=181527 RepID=A0ACD3AUZ1_9AGAR|nr:hypothetical protein BDN72DRAFT_607954 [Pluteus cervinus]
MTMSISNIQQPTPETPDLTFRTSFLHFAKGAETSSLQLTAKCNCKPIRGQWARGMGRVALDVRHQGREGRGLAEAGGNDASSNHRVILPP